MLWVSAWLPSLEGFWPEAGIRRKEVWPTEPNRAQGLGLN